MNAVCGSKQWNKNRNKNKSKGWRMKKIINLVKYRDLFKNGNKDKDRMSGIIVKLKIVILKENSNILRLRTEKY